MKSCSFAPVRSSPTLAGLASTQGFLPGGVSLRRLMTAARSRGPLPEALSPTSPFQPMPVVDASSSSPLPVRLARVVRLSSFVPPAVRASTAR